MNILANKTLILKRKVIRISCLILMSLILFFPSTKIFAKPIVIRFSHVVAEDTPKGRMATRFKNLVSQRIGDDKIKVVIYPNAQLYSDSKVVDELLNGNVEMAAPSLSKLKKYSKRIQVFDLPFLFVNPTAAENFLLGVYGKRILRLVEQSGLLGLGYLANGMRQISANKPIIYPEDIKGLTFRYPSSTITRDQYLALDAKPIKESFSKVYSRLANGDFDGQENTWSNIYSKRFYEHQPYMIESNHSYLGYMVLTSKKFWAGLDEELRDQLNTANAIVESGTTVHPMTVEERRLWTIALLPVWKKYEDEIGAELINAAASSR